MSEVSAITLIVAEPDAVAHRLAAAFGWDVSASDATFAEVSGCGGLTLWLNAPTEETSLIQQGIVLHCTVDDVSAATERARAAGAVILREPTRMDFGLESAMAHIEGGPIVDLTKPLVD